MHFGLEDFVDEFRALLESILGSELNRVLQDLIVEGQLGCLIKGRALTCVLGQP